MAHVRVQLRNAMAAALGNVPALAGRVYVNRVDPLPEGDLPAALLQVTEEQVSPLTQNAPTRLMERRMAPQVDLIGLLADGADDMLESLATSVEVALAAGAVFTFPLTEFRLVSANKGRINGDGQSDLMMLRMTYEAGLRSLENDPETII